MVRTGVMSKMRLSPLSRVSVHMTQGLWELLKVKKVTGRVSVVGRLLIMMNLPIQHSTPQVNAVRRVKMYLEKSIHVFGVTRLSSQY